MKVRPCGVSDSSFTRIEQALKPKSSRVVYSYAMDLFSPDDTHVAVVCLGLATACSLRCIWPNRYPQASGPYEDDDGKATADSENRAARTNQVVSGILTLGPVIGTGISIFHSRSLPAKAGAPHWDLFKWTGPMLWSSLIFQSLAVHRQTSIRQKYNLAGYAAISSLTLIAFACHEWTTLGHDLFWQQFTVASAILLSLLTFPRRPVVFRRGTAVLNESGVSVLDWFFFSWGLHKECSTLPAALKLQNLPCFPYSQSSAAVRKRYDAGDPTKALWKQIISMFLMPLVLQWSLLVLEALSEFGSRFVLHRLLQQLEASPDIGGWTWLWVGLLPLCLLCVSMCGNWSSWIGGTRIQLPMTGFLQSLVFEKSMRLRFGGSGKTGDKADKNCPSVMDAIETHSVILAQTFSSAYGLPVDALKVGLYYVYLSRLLGFTVVTIGGAFPVVAVLLSRKLSRGLRRAQAEHLEATERTSGLVSEALHGLRQIRLSSMEWFWQHRIFVARNHTLALAWRVSIRQELVNLAATLGPVLFASGTISIYAYRTGSFSPAVAFTSINLFGNIHAVIKQLPSRFTSLHWARLSYRKLHIYLQQPEQSAQSIVSDAVSFQNADLVWNVDQEAILKDVNLQFPNQGLSLITGKVGSGKSLLLSSLLEEATVQSGKFGKPPVIMTPNSPTKSHIVVGSVAFVSQPPWIEDRTIRENIVFGYGFDERRYQKVLRVCALTQDLALLSKGDLTVAGTGGSSLSGGQKWRVAFARALYSPAEFIISEDILAAVDTPIARYICDNALDGDLLRGRTMILATHHPEYCAKLSSCTVTLQDGSASAAYRSAIRKRSSELEENKQNSSEKIAADNQPASNATVDCTDATTKPTKPAQHTNPQDYWAILRAYAKQSDDLKNYILAIPVVLFYRFLSTSHSWWLAKWTSREQEIMQRHSTTYDVGVYLALSIASALYLSFQTLLFVRMGHESSRRLFEGLTRRVLKARLSWIDATPPGQVIQTLNSDIISSSPYTIFSSAMMLFLYIYFAQTALEVSKKLRPATNSCSFPVANHVSEANDGVTTIRAFGKVQTYVEGAQSHIDRSNSAYTHMLLGHAWLGIRLGVIGSLFVASVTAATILSRGTASSTGLAITLALQLRQALNITIGQINVTRTGLNAIDRVLALASIPSEEDENDGVVPANWPADGRIDVTSLGIRYGEDLPWALNGVTFSVGRGQRLGIVGRTGAGKSSLLNALLRFVDTTSGNISIDGQDISQIPRKQVRDAVTVIPQDAFLFSGTLRSNVDLYGRHSDAEIVATLQSVHFISSETGDNLVASDLDMQILSGGTNISHGQRQLVCLARVILEDECRILILDEATSGIDQATESVIQQAIRDHFNHVTTLVVAHKLLTIADFDSVLVLSQGKVAESGTPQALLERKGMFWDMVEQSKDAEAVKRIIGQKAGEAL